MDGARGAAAAVQAQGLQRSNVLRRWLCGQRRPFAGAFPSVPALRAAVRWAVGAVISPPAVQEVERCSAADMRALIKLRLGHPFRKRTAERCEICGFDVTTTADFL